MFAHRQDAGRSLTEKFANLRSLFAYMWAHPGKKLLFMGGEFAQFYEWNHNQSLDWHLTQWADHWRMQDLVKDLNRIYKQEPRPYDADTDPSGFQWIDANDADSNVVAFLRKSPNTADRFWWWAIFHPSSGPNTGWGSSNPAFIRNC